MNNIQQDIQLLTFGYIRDNEIKFNLNIPTDVKYICCQFVQPKEYFKSGGKQLEYNDNKKIVSNNTGYYNTAYGSTTIDASLNKKYVWKFRIIAQVSIYIGIDEIGPRNKLLWKETDFVCNKKTTNYSYCNDGFVYSNKISKKYSHKNVINKNYSNYSTDGYKKNDVVFMELNCSNKTNNYATLSYGVNEKALLCAFSDVKRNKKYKMAISLCGSNFSGNTSIELVQYFEENFGF